MSCNNIVKCISETNVESLINKNIKYFDEIKIGDITDSNSNYFIKQYYTGLITNDEHVIFISKYPNMILAKLYNEYILNNEDLLNINSNSFICENFNIEKIELVLKVYGSLSKDSNYFERFDKLIFALFCQNMRNDVLLKNNNLYNILYSTSKCIFKKYDWTIDYAKKMEVLDVFTLYCKDSNKYNELFGKVKTISVNNESHEKQNVINNSKKQDWILEKFGDNNG